MLQQYYLKKCRIKQGKRIRYLTKKVKIKTLLKMKCILAVVAICPFLMPSFIDCYSLPYIIKEKTAEERVEDFNTFVKSFKESDLQLYCFMDAESGLNAGAFNPKDGDGTPRCGILQFKWETYISYCVFKYGLSYFEKEVFYNKSSCEDNKLGLSRSQINCTRKMIDDGLIKHWGVRTRTLCKTHI